MGGLGVNILGKHCSGQTFADGLMATE